MRAREYLYEDGRSKLEKLQELIDHPGTEETLRDVARGRLAHLKSLVPAEPQRSIAVTTNVSITDLDRPFLKGLSLGDLYDNLVDLQPSPSEIQFGRQGVIQLMVPPPFMGKTKQQYLNDILRACPGARNISSRMLPEGAGYLFAVSYL